MLDISVAIITLNEQDNIARCLSSLPKGCEIVLVDSGSQDRTCAIATSFKAKVFENVFVNYASQKNFAVERCKRRWILSIDADEQLDVALKSYLENNFDTNLHENICFRLPRQLVYNQKVLRFGKTADAPIRLFPSHLRFQNEIHESVDTKNLKVEKLPGRLLHYSYKNSEDYFCRFNSYTTKIAENHFKNGKSSTPSLGHFLRPFLEFFSRYLLRLGFLDGKEGYTYALYSSLYAYVKYEKLYELRATGEKAPDSRTYSESL